MPARAIAARYADAGLQTPATSELIKTIHQRPKVIEGVIGYLVKQGTLVRLAEGVYLHRDVVAAAREKLSTKKGETIDVGQFKDLFGISRKVAIPLLEFFDKDEIDWRDNEQGELYRRLLADVIVHEHAVARVVLGAIVLSGVLDVLGSDDPEGADHLVGVQDPQARKSKHGAFFTGYLLDVATGAGSQIITAVPFPGAVCTVTKP